MPICVSVRCYAELNDFLRPERRQKTFILRCDEGAPVKDLLEGAGVPHTEVDLVLVNGESAGFDTRLADGDHVAAYPVFEAFDVGPITRVRPVPLRAVRFVLDVHLGRLAALLRLSGFDCWYRTGSDDQELARVSVAERRILLTRDRALLKRRAVTHGSFVRATEPVAQLSEVFRRFQLSGLARPFTRCMRCNGELVAAARSEVADRVPPRSRSAFERFLRCVSCGNVYWEGSHHARLLRILEEAARSR